MVTINQIRFFIYLLISILHFLSSAHCNALICQPQVSRRVSCVTGIFLQWVGLCMLPVNALSAPNSSKERYEFD